MSRTSKKKDKKVIEYLEDLDVELQKLELSDEQFYEIKSIVTSIARVSSIRTYDIETLSDNFLYDIKLLLKEMR